MTRVQLSALRPRRYSLTLPLRVHVREIKEKRLESAAAAPLEEETITENISSVGCYFLLSSRPKAGTHIEMDIRIPPVLGSRVGSRIHCRGKIVRVEEGRVSGKIGVGCAFYGYRILPDQPA